MNLPVGSAELRILRGALRIGSELAVDPETAFHGVAAVGEKPDSGSGQQRRAERCIARGRNRDRQVEHIADDAAPERAARPAADQENPLPRAASLSIAPLSCRAASRPSTAYALPADSGGTSRRSPLPLRPPRDGPSGQTPCRRSHRLRPSPHLRKGLGTSAGRAPPHSSRKPCTTCPESHARRSAWTDTDRRKRS